MCVLSYLHITLHRVMVCHVIYPNMQDPRYVGIECEPGGLGVGLGLGDLVEIMHAEYLD